MNAGQLISLLKRREGSSPIFLDDGKEITTCIERPTAIPGRRQFILGTGPAPTLTIAAPEPEPVAVATEPEPEPEPEPEKPKSRAPFSRGKGA